jgi:hypothetical protein
MPAVALLQVAVATALGALALPESRVAVSAVFAACVLATLGLAVFQVVRFGLRRGAATGLTGLVIGLLGGFVLAASLAAQVLFDDTPDPFGRDLVVPAALVVREPLDSAQPLAVDQEPEVEAESKVFREACGQVAAKPSPEVEVGLTALSRFAGPAKQQLLSHLARTGVWHVATENGKPYAYRRFAEQGRTPRSSLNGYYGAGRCQLRVVIGLDGPALAAPWFRHDVATTVRAGAGAFAPRQKQKDYGTVGPQSYLVVESEGPAVEIFEDSPSEDRELTRFALGLVERELARAVAGPADAGPLPAVNSPSIALTRGMQGGIYLVAAHVNPGEPGTAYLKAFEAVRNIELSKDPLMQRSSVVMGWSTDPGELFTYESEITIYEGDWGVYYPARFELWFTPDSGGPERVLIQDVFRIEGWQR